MTNRYSIVGTQFTGLPESFISAIAPGTDVMLVREPTNQYDPNAVAVWIDGKRIGYVPRKQNAGLAERIDASGQDWAEPDRPTHVSLATDGTMTLGTERTIYRAIPAKFVRSPNSGFPMVEVQE